MACHHDPWCRIVRGEHGVHVPKNRTDLRCSFRSKTGISLQRGNRFFERRSLTLDDRREEMTRLDTYPGRQPGKGGQIWLSPGFDPRQRTEADPRLDRRLPDRQRASPLLQHVAESCDSFDLIWSRWTTSSSAWPPVGASNYHRPFAGRLRSPCRPRVPLLRSRGAGAGWPE
jgi:hypothetical protein